MDGMGVSGSCLDVSDGKTDSMYPICFGVSCAFVALRVLSVPEKDENRWSELCSIMLRGSAQLLGLLVWKIQRKDGDEMLQKLEAAEQEIKGLKEMRREDARANEKVVGIFASQEQSWSLERRKLQQHVRIVLKELKVVKANNEAAVSELNGKLEKLESSLQSKDELLREMECKRKELEEKLKRAEETIEEMRESATRVAQEHSTELWKHKTAFLELVSNQRKLEAEIGRTVKQLEAKKQEIDSAFQQKEESNLLAQKLSLDVVKMQKDLEQKDKLLSAMLRKSKLDSSEKQMLLKELKIEKVKRKQAEIEIERWRAVSESKDSRRERHSLRSMFALHPRSDDPSFRKGPQVANCVLEFENPEFQMDSDFYSPLSQRYSTDQNDTKQIEGWVRIEAEKYATAIEKRHHLELDAFVEQMKLKDEKLEAFRWRLLNMEMESKRIQPRIEAQNQEISQLRHENMNMEALFSQTQEELKTLKEQFVVQIKPEIFQKVNVDPSLQDPALLHETSSSKVKSVNKITRGSDQDATKTIDIGEVKHSYCHPRITASVTSPEIELGEARNIAEQECCQEETASQLDADTVDKFASPCQSSTGTNTSPWRMDLHALGVMYKIKRLKQQLLMLERLTGKQGACEETKNSSTKGFSLFLSLLNKQVGRYQSLQVKTDELCKRMHTSAETSKRETKMLEHFLEETFQLQRYMVSTGQKLIEVQTKLGSGLVGISEKLDGSVSFDMSRFTDNIRTLFQDIQRGLEVRIARIIGDLEGTLACEGIIGLRR